MIYFYGSRTPSQKIKTAYFHDTQYVVEISGVSDSAFLIEEKSLLPAPRHETLDPLPSTKRQTPKNYLFVYFYFTRQILPCEFSRVELQILWQFSQVKWNGCFFWRNRRMRHIFSTIGKVFVTLPKILGRLGWSAKAETVFASVYLSLLFPYLLLFCLWVIYYYDYHWLRYLDGARWNIVQSFYYGLNF